MAKVDWITWKTDTNEIINPSISLDKINDIYNDYDSYMNSIVYEGIKHEIIKGGLDSDSLNIVGVSPANDSANNIINSIENVKNMMNTLKNEIYLDCLRQKSIEKQQLMIAIEDKIKEEKNILRNTNILRDKILNSNSVLNIEEVDSIIEITNERIRRLEERLENARSL